MRSFALELIGFVLTVVFLECWFLRHWLSRKPLGHSIVAAAVVTAVLWMVLLVGLAHVEWGWKTATEPPLTLSDWALTAILIIVDTTILAGVAVVPAAIVGVVYRKRLENKV